MKVIAVVVVLAVAHGTAFAADASAQNHGVPVPIATTTSRITVDGVLDEPAWLEAAVVDQFRVSFPTDGAVPKGATMVRLLFDGEAIVVGATLHGAPTVRFGRRDADMPDSDWLWVSIDSNHEHTSAFRFGVNPAGGVRDELITADATHVGWDAVWEAATNRDEYQWSAEMRIPLKALRYKAGSGGFGIMIARFNMQSQEHSLFPHIPITDAGGIAAYGHLVGLGALPERTGLTVVPHVRSTANSGRLGSSENVSVSAGLDAEAKLSNSMGIALAVNPDFGQIEGDPAVLNLTAFELRRPERRPFFVEGLDLFTFSPGLSADALLYTRRVGAPPARLAALKGEYPAATTIAGAMKIVTRSKQWRFGLFDAVTRPEYAHATDTNEQEGLVPVAASANYAAADCSAPGGKAGPPEGQWPLSSHAGMIRYWMCIDIILPLLVESISRRS
jgi:hypothetical protein